MGHQRLGYIPKSQKWQTVVASVAGGGGLGRGVSRGYVADVADRTLSAAAAGLERAIGDEGLRFAFYLLTQIALAARHDDWLRQLGRLGIRLSDDASLFELTSEIQGVIDDHIESHGRRTDISEMAQQAVGEAIAELAGPNARTLFGSGAAELQDAIRRLSTRVGFARLGQRFFGQFVTRFLNFYLSRVTAGQVGRANLDRIKDLSSFNDTLAVHCQQSARIVRDFCGEWYSKTEFQTGIDLENSSHFVAVAIRKLQAELAKQREGQ